MLTDSVLLVQLNTSLRCCFCSERWRRRTEFSAQFVLFWRPAASPTASCRTCAQFGQWGHLAKI